MNLRGTALMVGSGLSNQLGAAVAALAFPVLGPVGVVAVRQWMAAAVLVTAGRPRLRTFTASQWRPVLGLAAVFATMPTGADLRRDPKVIELYLGTLAKK